jgi:hypothetical protein
MAQSGRRVWLKKASRLLVVCQPAREEEGGRRRGRGSRRQLSSFALRYFCALV